MGFFLREADIWKAKKQEIIDRINSTGLPLVLFGKAPVVNTAFFQEITVPIEFICDNDPEKQGTSLWGKPLISVDELQEHYGKQQYNVLILVPFVHQIVPQLEALSVSPAEIFWLDLYFEQEDTAEFYEENTEVIEKLSNCLGDRISKKVFEAVIRYRINRDPAYLKEIALPRTEQYFPQELGKGELFLKENEIFVDAGAFNGDTVRAFLKAAGGNGYKAIYAFEPDVENFSKCKAFVDGSGIERVQCYNIGVSDRKESVCFMSDDSSSKADLDGDVVIEADALDHLIAGIPVTYLKMDVEGMECKALRGAAQIIKQHKPKLAICTYHADADMLNVPKLILELNPTYRLYFRHYSNAIVETVCYAV